LAKTVALTGATGFVGRRVTDKLIADGVKLRVLARNVSAVSPHPAAKVISGSLTDVEAIDRLVEGVDCVVHVAGATHAPSRKVFFDINTEGTRNVVEAARRARVIRLVHVSSLAASVPSISDYAESKAAGEQIALNSGLPQVLVLRPCAVYGEGDTATLPLIRELTQKTAKIPSHKTNRFGLIHVEDLAGIIADAAVSQITGMRELDDSFGGYVWEDLAGVTRKHFGTPGKVTYLPAGLLKVAAGGFDLFARLSGKSAMISSGSIRQLYHPEWLVKGEGWPRSNPIDLETGLIRTIKAYQAVGMLPPGNQTSRS
jgi:nucleoside-diphosphate-sugar epimerase